MKRHSIKKKRNRIEMEGIVTQCLSNGMFAN